jgi:deoxyuridine 5'-triphosphate nucleotidohydrolase
MIQNPKSNSLASLILEDSQLVFHRCRSDAKPPFYATNYSACFDLSAAFADTTTPPWAELKAYTPGNEEVVLGYFLVGSSIPEYEIPPGFRVLVPTGWKVQIPANHSLRVHPRSGLALKKGLTLINSEGIIDRDYDGELFLPLINHSDVGVCIRPGDRLAQGELVPSTQSVFGQTGSPSRPLFEIMENDMVFTQAVIPSLESNRRGGFGSTGIDQNVEPGPGNGSSSNE